MSRPEENIDQLIRAALSNEEAEAYDNLAEQGIIEEAFSVLKGRAKFIIWMSVFFSFAFFVLAVIAGFQFFEATETKELIMWAVVLIFSMMAVSMLKLWYFMEMNKNATVRELKRVELQVAHLAKSLETR